MSEISISQFLVVFSVLKTCFEGNEVIVNYYFVSIIRAIEKMMV